MGKSAKLSQVPNGPAFNATKTSSQTFATGAASKVLFNNEEYDTNSNYDTSTGRFTPTVAGYYQINSAVVCSGASGIGLLSIYKNGLEIKRGVQTSQGSPSLIYGQNVSGLVYCNGSTDYIEIYIYFSSAGVTADTGGSSYFDAHLGRPA